MGISTAKIITHEQKKVNRINNIYSKQTEAPVAVDKSKKENYANYYLHTLFREFVFQAQL